MLPGIRRFLSSDDGATAVEYSLIAALLSISAMVAISAMGGSIQDVFNTLSTQVDFANQAAVNYTSQQN